MLLYNIHNSNLTTRPRVPPVQAEAEALSEVFETNLSELATKSDLHHEMKELKISLRHEIKGSVSTLKFELFKWLIGLIVGQTGLLIGLLKFFSISS